jgi:hypothetical protein
MCSLRFLKYAAFVSLHRIDRLAFVMETYCAIFAVWAKYIYRMIPSVLDPKKCEYLKDYSLDSE